MHKKLRITFIISVIVLFLAHNKSTFLHAEIPFTHIKDMNTFIKPTEMHYSPLNGCVWWKTGIIESLYRYGNEHDATIKLIKELFYLQRDEVTFDVTTLNRKPAKYFKVSTIGKIANFIKQNTLNDQSSQETLKTAHEELITLISKDLAFDDRISESQQKISTQIKALNEFNKKIQSLKKDNARYVEDQKKLKTMLRTIQARLDSAQKKKESANISDLEKEKNTLEQQLKSLDYTIEKNRNGIKEIQSLPEYKKTLQFIHNESLTNKSLGNLATLIIESIKECTSKNSMYVPYTTLAIFLAFLWKKIDEKKELIDYFVACPDILTNCSLLKINNLQKYWINQHYNQEDYQNFLRDIKNLSQAELVIFLKDNYELSVFSALAHKIWDPRLPPIISSIGESEYVHNEIIYTFANCTETAIRNFINILLKDPKKITLDNNKLIKLSQKNKFNVNQKLVEFYTEHNSLANMVTRKVHNAFNQLVSNLGNNIIYLKPTVGHGICELRAVLSNVLKVLNYLFFNNDEKFLKMSKSEQLNFLCKAISSANFVLTWKLSDDEITIDTQDFNLEIDFFINTEPAFTWKFMEHHSVIVEMESQQSKEFNAITSSLMHNLNGNNGIVLNIIALLIKPLNLNALLNNQQLPFSQLYFLINALYSSNNDIKLDIALSLIKINVELNSTFLNQFIARLIDSFPIDDPYYKEEVLIAAAKNKISFFKEPFRNFINTMNKEESNQSSYSLITNIFHEKLDQFYNDILPLIKKIKSEPIEGYDEAEQSEDIAHFNNTLFQIFNSIVLNKAQQLYPIVNERVHELTSKQKALLFSLIIINAYDDLFNLVKDNLDSIIDDEDLSIVIEDIITTSRFQFYDVLPSLINKLSNKEDRKKWATLFKETLTSQTN